MSPVGLTPLPSPSTCVPSDLGNTSQNHHGITWLKCIKVLTTQNAFQKWLKSVDLIPWKHLTVGIFLEAQKINRWQQTNIRKSPPIHSRIGVTKPCCRRWPNGYVKVAEPRHQNDLCFFLLGVQHIFWLQKAKKQHLWNLGNSFFLLGWFLFWFRGISKHKLWSTFLWCWNMQSSKDMLNLKHMRQGRRDFTVETKDFAASILLRFSCRESCSRCFCWRFPIILELFSLFCTNWQHFQEGWSHAAKVW